jgi:pimeloyl-ACP methyl ester carboxylesterase
MLFVPPLPNDRSCWVYQAAHFSSWFRTISVDLPGLGASPPADAGLTMADLAEACWEAVDEVTDEPAVLVGLSIGSTIVKYMANLRPERAAALVVTGGPLYADPAAPDIPVDKPFGYFADALQRDGADARRALLEENFSPDFAASELGRYFVRLFAERTSRADLPSVVHMIRALMPADPVSLHPGIRCPVLIIMGGRDKPRSRDGHRAMHAALPTSELRVIEDGGHCCNMERPWEYDRYVTEFLVKHRLLEP